jgi:hypothetical protein
VGSGLTQSGAEERCARPITAADLRSLCLLSAVRPAGAAEPYSSPPLVGGGPRSSSGSLAKSPPSAASQEESDRRVARPRSSSSNKRRFHVVRWITMVKVSCRRHSQYKCQSRHKQDTKSHHNNWDGIISGNLEHRETPKIADPSLVPEMAEGGYSPLQGEKNDLLWLVKPTAKAKTVQSCSDRTSLGESADRRR